MTTIPRKAVGDIAPFRMDTMIVIPVSRNGIENSICSFRAGVIFKDVSTMSAFRSLTSLIRPFHSPVTYNISKCYLKNV